MKWTHYSAAILYCFVQFFTALSINAQSTEPDALTPNAPENPETLIISAGRDTPPYYFVNEEGELVGWLIDLWNLWSEKTGTPITFKHGSFADSLNFVRNGEADIHAGCFYSEERDTFLDYASPVCDVSTHYFFHEDLLNINSLDDLLPFRVGAIEGDRAIDFIQSQQPDIDLKLYPDNLTMFEAIKNDEVRVFIKDTAIGLHYLNQNNIIQNYRYPIESPLYAKPFIAAVTEGRRQLVTRINQGMRLITSEERIAIEEKWTGVDSLSKDNTLAIGFPVDYAPFGKFSPDGRAIGLLADIWHRLAQDNQWAYQFVPLAPREIIPALLEGNIDIALAVGLQGDHADAVSSSDPLTPYQTYMFFKTDNAFELGNNTTNENPIGYISDSPEAHFLLTEHTELNLVPYPTLDRLIIALMNDEINAFIAEYATTNESISDLGYSNQIENASRPFYSDHFRIITSAKNEELQQQVDQALAAFPSDELTVLRSRWIIEEQQTQKQFEEFQLTPEQEAWLQSHADIRIGVTLDWYPLEYYEDGQPKGIIIDFMRDVEDRLGIEFDWVVVEDWNKIREYVENGEIDAFASLAQLPERMEYLHFSRPFLEFDAAIVTAGKYTFVGDLNTFKDKPVAVVDGYATAIEVAQDYPDLNILHVPNVAAGLRSVASGEAEAFVGNMATISNQIGELGLTSLKISGTLPYTTSTHFASRKSWLPLVNMVDSALASIPLERRNELRSGWMSVQIEQQINWWIVWRYAAIIFTILGIILGISLFWIRKLSTEIERRQEAESKSEMLLESTGEGIFGVDLDGCFTFLNPAACSMLHYTSKQLIGKPVHETIHNKFEDGRGYPLDRCPMRRAYMEGISHSTDDEVLWTSDNIPLPVAYSTNPIFREGILTGAVVTFRDIREKRLAEQALRKSEEQFRAIADYTYDWESWIDENGKVVWVNDAVERVTGRRVDECMAMENYPLPLVYEEDRRLVGDAIAKAMQQNPFADVEFRINPVNKKSSKLRWAAINGQPIYDTVGNWRGYRCSVRDITDRKRAEKQLQRREAQTRQIIEMSPYALALFDSYGMIQYLNKRFNTLFGYHSNELLSFEDWMKASFPDEAYRYQVSNLWQQLIDKSEQESDEITSTEVRIQTRPGNIVDIEMGVVSLDKMTLVAFHDLTQRKKQELQIIQAKEQAEFANAKLNEAERRRQLALDAANIGVFSCDLKRYEKDHQLNELDWSWDSRMNRQLGFSDMLMPNISGWLDCMHPDDLLKFETSLRNAIETGKRFDVDYRIVWKDGSIRYITSVGEITMNAHDKPIRLDGVTMDFTALKQTQAELKVAMDAANSANKAKSLFLANMSHEIRTPMNAILGYAELLKRDEHTGESQMENINIIHRSGEHLLSLINDILEMSKIEAGKITIETAPFDMHSLIKDIAAMFRMRIKDKMLNFDVHTNHEDNLYLLGDEGKVRQILINLLSNAVKFTKDGGIALRMKIDKETELGLPITIDVEDTGAGIAKHELEKVFDHFEQTESGRKHGGGTGLGMPISRQFARMMGGDLVIKSEVGKGTTFTLTLCLPASEMIEVDEEIKTQEINRLKPGQKPWRALVVDDREVNVDLLARLLDRTGFEYLTAENGKEAIDLMEQHEVDIVLMDMVMPVMDGKEATKIIRANDHYNDIPIVIVSASAMDEERDEALASGANSFIRKPFKQNEMLTLIGSLLPVEYEYAGEGKEADAAAATGNGSDAASLDEFWDINEMDESLREAMLQAVDDGDRGQMLDVIDQIESWHAGLANKLRDLVKQYDYDSIEKLLSNEN